MHATIVQSRKKRKETNPIQCPNHMPRGCELDSRRKKLRKAQKLLGTSRKSLLLSGPSPFRCERYPESRGTTLLAKVISLPVLKDPDAGGLDQSIQLNQV